MSKRYFNVFHVIQNPVDPFPLSPAADSGYSYLSPTHEKTT